MLCHVMSCHVMSYEEHIFRDVKEMSSRMEYVDKKDKAVEKG
jgi:hypothetical protein